MSASQDELLASLIDQLRMGPAYELYVRGYLTKDELLQLVTDIINEF